MLHHSYLFFDLLRYLIILNPDEGLECLDESLPGVSVSADLAVGREDEEASVSQHVEGLEDEAALAVHHSAQFISIDELFAH